MTDEETAQRRVVANDKAWASVLLTAPPEALCRGPRRRWRQWMRYDRRCSTGTGTFPGSGRFAPVRRQRCPFVVVDRRGEEVGPVSAFLRDLMLTDMSPLTVRSYANDLLRWWRLLHALEVDWDRATRAEVEVLVGWMRSAENPQRLRGPSASVSAPSVNLRSGKRALGSGTRRRRPTTAGSRRSTPTCSPAAHTPRPRAGSGRSKASTSPCASSPTSAQRPSDSPISTTTKTPSPSSACPRSEHEHDQHRPRPGNAAELAERLTPVVVPSPGIVAGRACGTLVHM